jgi:hypothetical protein
MFAYALTWHYTGNVCNAKEEIEKVSSIRLQLLAHGNWAMTKDNSPKQLHKIPLCM